MGMSSEHLVLALIGLTIVFAVLAVLSAIISLARKLDDRWLARESEDERAASGQPPTIDAITLVLVAAAAATYLRGRYRIRRVKRLLAPDAPSSPWSGQGKLVLMGSHVVRGRWPGER